MQQRCRDRERIYRYTRLSARIHIHNALGSREAKRSTATLSKWVIFRASAAFAQRWGAANFRQCFFIGFYTWAGKVASRSDARLALLVPVLRSKWKDTPHGKLQSCLIRCFLLHFRKAASWRTKEEKRKKEDDNIYNTFRSSDNDRYPHPLIVSLSFVLQADSLSRTSWKLPDWVVLLWRSYCRNGLLLYATRLSEQTEGTL